jgi:hypothetical protein
MVRVVASKRHDGYAGVTFGSAVGGTELLRSPGRRVNEAFTAAWPDDVRATVLIHDGRCAGRCTQAVRLIVRMLDAFCHALLFAFAKGLVSYPFFPLTSHACALVYFHKSPFSPLQPFEVISSYSKMGSPSWPGTSDLFE